MRNNGNSLRYIKHLVNFLVSISRNDIVSNRFHSVWLKKWLKYSPHQCHKTTQWPNRKLHVVKADGLKRLRIRQSTKLRKRDGGQRLIRNRPRNRLDGSLLQTIAAARASAKMACTREKCTQSGCVSSAFIIRSVEIKGHRTFDPLNCIIFNGRTYIYIFISGVRPTCSTDVFECSGRGRESDSCDRLTPCRNVAAHWGMDIFRDHC